MEVLPGRASRSSLWRHFDSALQIPSHYLWKPICQHTQTNIQRLATVNTTRPLNLRLIQTLKNEVDHQQYINRQPSVQGTSWYSDFPPHAEVQMYHYINVSHALLARSGLPVQACLECHIGEINLMVTSQVNWTRLQYSFLHPPKTNVVPSTRHHSTPFKTENDSHMSVYL